MTPELYDLISKMLTIEPNLRIGAIEALEHPYFSSDPLPCSKEELKVEADESHEYIERMKKRFIGADFEKQILDEDTKMQSVSEFKQKHVN
jgi:serine/threonine protein kinase